MAERDGVILGRVAQGDRIRAGADRASARPLSIWEGVIGNKNLLRGAA
ncbi:MAG TPA: hypothetical protein VNE82_06650 [Candidatus Binataceae bacterium]|nr:hypothetical protein [Candidatus Binataceae bacterium]